MGKLVAIVGNTGVGKTTLVDKLCADSNFTACYEESVLRPFQVLFSEDHKSYALANQVDFLLARAVQEQHVRSVDLTGLEDGGLELDFHVYTKLFHQKGFLSHEAYALCERLYHFIREFLPAPELFIYLQASIHDLTKRFEKRGDVLRLAQIEDMQAIENLLSDWLGSIPQENLVIINSESEERDFSMCIQAISGFLEGRENLS